MLEPMMNGDLFSPAAIYELIGASSRSLMEARLSSMGRWLTQVLGGSRRASATQPKVLDRLRRAFERHRSLESSNTIQRQRRSRPSRSVTCSGVEWRATPYDFGMAAQGRTLPAVKKAGYTGRYTGKPPSKKS